MTTDDGTIDTSRNRCKLSVQLYFEAAMRRAGFTLIELVTCIAIVITLGGIVVPSLGTAQRKAAVARCAGSMRAIGVGLTNYAAAYDRALPPFSLPKVTGGNLLEAGHFGGYSSKTDPNLLGRFPNTATALGLFSLQQERMIPTAALVCPSARGLESASYFPYTSRFSTYCMRIPYSQDLFAGATFLAYYKKPSLVNIYSFGAAGDRIIHSNTMQQIPQGRIDICYRDSSEVSCGDGDFDPAQDAVASDMFWRQDYSATAPPCTEAQTSYPVRWQWCHGSQFNVLFGDGSVRTRDDSGTVSANSNAAGKSLPDDNACYGTYAERVWQFFDRKRP